MTVPARLSSSLAGRPRLAAVRRRLLAALDAQPNAQAAAAAAQAQARIDELEARWAGLPATRPLTPPYHPPAPATDRLFARLGTDEDALAARLTAVLGDSVADLLAAGPPVERPAALLHLAVHCEFADVLEATGLSNAEPPEEVHHMARGPLAAGGALRLADVVAECLQDSGADVEAGRGLDFGCSSGRVVRALHAAYPDAAWAGCDPNGPAIAWAADALPGIGFFESPTDPPLPVPDGAYDHAFAISIWSHYDAGPALAWLDELRRVLAPGGRLLLTTHGLSSVAVYAAHGLRPAAQLSEIVQALYTDGFWFAPEFGEEGDWGVAHPGWGTAFFTPEWLLARVRGAWHLDVFVPAGLAFNQDIYVLRSTTA